MNMRKGKCGNSRPLLSELKKPRAEDSLKKIKEDYFLRELICYGELERFDSILDCICGKLNNPFFKDGNKFYRRCRHQAHLTNIAIEKATETLEELRNELELSKDFDALLLKVNSIQISGFGPLAKYDFCVRFGYKRGLKPDKFVYLHAGTRDGAKAIKHLLPSLEKKEYKDRIPLAKLPEELRNMNSIDIENLLCIFKERLASLKKI